MNQYQIWSKKPIHYSLFIVFTMEQQKNSPSRFEDKITSYTIETLQEK